MEIRLETTTLRKQWHIWTYNRDRFNEEHGRPDIDTGTKYVRSDNPYFGEYMDKADRYWVTPSEIIKDNLIAIGKARKELVGYSYDWDTEVPYGVRLTDIEWVHRDGSFYIVRD